MLAQRFLQTIAKHTDRLTFLDEVHADLFVRADADRVHRDKVTGSMHHDRAARARALPKRLRECLRATWSRSVLESAWPPALWGAGHKLRERQKR